MIVLYNSYADTADCLGSLQAATYSDLTLVLVDNGSSDDSGKRLKEEFPQVLHIRSDNNLGFAGGCNLGIRAALENGADFICLLNNDTLVDPGFIEPLIDRAAVTPRAGILGGKIFYADPPDLLWFAGGCIDTRRGFTNHRGQDLPDASVFNQPMTVDYITGCLFFVRASLFRDLGLLDDRFFMYAEEVDFCLRVRRSGYSCFYEPKSVIWHKVSRSMGRSYRPLFWYYQARNLLEAYRIHLGGRRFTKQIMHLVWYLVLYRSYVMLRLYRTGAAPYIVGLWLGGLDYMRGRMGRSRYNWLP